ncbi:hypothetical protein C3E98_012990 [Pseudomonas sp. MWU13-2625]|nr:hypothetical protein C3E98_012990 [Pseudomonas sp. MWU13-2625]
MVGVWWLLNYHLIWIGRFAVKDMSFKNMMLEEMLEEIKINKSFAVMNDGTVQALDGLSVFINGKDSFVYQDLNYDRRLDGSYEFPGAKVVEIVRDGQHLVIINGENPKNSDYDNTFKAMKNRPDDPLISAVADLYGSIRKFFGV